MIYANHDMNLEIYPLDVTRWDDFETLFGERGACGGCWCMYWRLKNSEFNRLKGNGNREAMLEIVRQNEVPGLLAYVEGKPSGWCSVAPREDYIRLENSRVLKRVDEKPVWSITCFFIARPFRRKGLALELVKGSIDYCRSKGAEIVEAYPVVPYAGKIPDAFAWTGFPGIFEKAGFVVAERRSPSKPIMRYYL